MCENFEELDEPESKASLIWILGENAEKIDNVEELLQSYLDSFIEDAYPVSIVAAFNTNLIRFQVQLQTLSAIVKLFLKKPEGPAQTLVQKVLTTATSDCDNSDVRDRAFIYWRLLSTDTGAARVSRWYCICKI